VRPTFVFLVLLVAHSLAAQTPAPGHAKAVDSYGKLPLAFEANQGQSNPQVKFLSRGAGYSLFLTSDEAVLTLRSSSPEEAALPSANARTLPVRSARESKLERCNPSKSSGRDWLVPKPRGSARVGE